MTGDNRKRAKPGCAIGADVGFGGLATAFESGGRGFESLRARQHLGQILDRPKSIRVTPWVTATKNFERGKLALTRGCIPNSEKLSNRYILNSSSRTAANNATADGSINWAEPSIFPESSLGIGVSLRQQAVAGFMHSVKMVE
jgi:hypothetical protein